MTTATIKPRQRPLSRIGFALVLAAFLTSTAAADDNWTLRADVSLTSIGGHDPYVVTVTGTAFEPEQDLETQSDLGRHLALGYDRGSKWSYGADFFFFTGAQELTLPTASTDGTTLVSYALTEREYRSRVPAEVLFFEQLGDTDMNAWTFDLYARRVIAQTDNGTLRFLFGLRNADFDNDNHFVAGLVDVGGSRIDASSNYGRMLGPLAGLVYDLGQGRHRFRFSVNASVVSGDTELSATLSDFLGPFVDGSENIVASRNFRLEDSVSIPIFDARAEWRYSRGNRWTWIAGGHFSQWGDVSVPPGVQPDGTLETLYEKSITFTSVLVGIEVSF